MILNKPYLYWFRLVVPVVLTVMTIGVLVANVPEESLIAEYASRGIAYAIITGYALYFCVWMRGTELSLAHIVGMLGFLSFSQNVYPLIMWAIGLGAVIGAVLTQQPPRSQTFSADEGLERLRKIIFVTARVVLSFFASSQVYIRLGGSLPFESAAWNTNDNLVLALTVYTLVYITVYASIFLLELYAEQKPVRTIINDNLALLIIVLFFPVVFTWLGAEISATLSTPSEVISLAGIILLIMGLHVLSRSQYQMRRQLDELQTLSVVTRAVRTHLGLASLLRTIYEQVATQLNVQNFTVVLVNPDTDQFEFPLVIRKGKEEQGNDATRARLHNNTLIQHVLDSGVPLLISDNVAKTAHDLRLEPPKETVYSWMGAPLIAGSQKLGVMTVASQDTNRQFSTADLRLLNIIASSASVALENTRLYQQQAIRLEQMSTLNNITALLTGTLSPETVLDIVISSASTITEANAVAVYLFREEDQEELPMVRSAGLGIEFSTNPPKPLLHQTTNGIPLHQRMPLAISDINKDERAKNLKNALVNEGKYALVELPLSIGQKSLGILVGYYNTVQAFKEERLELLRGYATQAAQAIQNARTYATTDEALHRTLEQLVALEGIGRLLTSTIDLQRICDLVLEHATEATRATSGLVVLKEAEAPQLMAHHGYDKDALKQDDLFENGVFAKVLAYGETRLIENVTYASDYTPLQPKTKAVLTIPIRRGKEVAGLISLESAQVKCFSQEDSHFVEQIANQAVIAIDNARLFQRITETRDRLQVILDAMDEGLILVNGEGRVALANPHIDKLGLEPSNIVNRALVDMLDDEKLMLTVRLGFRSRREIEALVTNIQGKGSWTEYENTLFTVSNEAKATRYIQRDIIPVHDEDQRVIGALMVFHDKTEEHELERAREEFSRMLVHDLRSPLTAVTTSLRLLQELVTPENELHNIVHSTTDASRRAIRKLLGRVNSLLDISRMESGKLAVETEVTDLAPLIENAREELSPLARELEIDIRMELADDLPPVNIDSDKVERLLLNLVDNALKYSPVKGKVRVRSHPPGINGAAIGFVRIDVVDNGPGIPDDYKQTLFDQFVQVKGRERVRQGVGLGLTFCKLVVEAHGGRIWIEDNPAGGSVFTFTLPIVKMTRLPDDESVEGAANP